MVINIKKGLVISLIGHIAIVLLCYVNIEFNTVLAKKSSVNFKKKDLTIPVIQAGLVKNELVEKAIKRQQQDEQKKIDNLKKQKQSLAKEKAEAEKKQLALKKETQELDKKKKLLEENQRQLKADKEKMLAEQKKHQADQKKKQEAEKIQQEQLQKQLQEQLLVEQLDSYKQEIAQKIYQNRTLSLAFTPDLFCEIKFSLNSDGSIDSLKITKSSGNKAYDSSAEIAVYKSTPFTMPEETKLLSKLKDVVIGFKNDE